MSMFWVAIAAGEYVVVVVVVLVVAVGVVLLTLWGLS